jgi:AcrR family transcriptional regulator
MLISAVALLREQGASGASIDAVLDSTGIPRGSTYHYFPGGRDEMLVGAVRLAGDHITALIDGLADRHDPLEVVAAFVGFWRQALAASDFRAGCPIVAMAVDRRSAPPEVTELVREIFTTWRERIAGLVTARGVPAARAGRLATLVVAAVEGAIVLCRVEGCATPLDDVVAEVGLVLAAAG